ncbi:MAG: hypothetical protein ACYCYA_01005 [Actinomycetes bacterium]
MTGDRGVAGRVALLCCLLGDTELVADSRPAVAGVACGSDRLAEQPLGVLRADLGGCESQELDRPVLLGWAPQAGAESLGDAVADPLGCLLVEVFAYVSTLS